MSHYNHQHEAASAPQQQQEAYYEGQGVAAYVAPQPPPPPPPPIGYPTKDAPSVFHQQAVPIETKSKGEGFWKGCVAALCCCWVFDVCCC